MPDHQLTPFDFFSCHSFRHSWSDYWTYWLILKYFPHPRWNQWHMSPLLWTSINLPLCLSLLELKAVQQNLYRMGKSINQCIYCLIKELGTSNRPIQKQTWVLSRTPGSECAWQGAAELWGWMGTPGLSMGSPGIKVQKSCIDGGPRDSGCWLRWVCRGAGLGGLGGGPLAGGAS